MDDETSPTGDSIDRSTSSVIDAILSEDRKIISVGLALSIIIVAIIPFVVNQYYIRIVFLMLMWVGLSTSWNIIGGFIGYPSFGHVAFLGIGGFTVGLIGQAYSVGGSVGELIALILLGGLVSATFAAAIAYPLLRLRGGYFAIATLGITVVIREVFNNVDILGGGIGIAAPTLTPPILDSLTIQYYLMVILAILTVLAAYLIKRSKMGYAFAAIREEEDAAMMLGVPTVRYKISGFIISAFFPGVIGGLYVYFLAYFTAGDIYNIQHTIDMIVYAVIGGLGTILGPVIGAPIMVFLSRIVLGDVLRAHVFLTGLFIVVVMLFVPKGIVGTMRTVKDQMIRMNESDNQ